MKQKSFCSAKEIIHQVKRQPKEWVISLHLLIGRGLMSRTHKELKKFNMNKRNNRGNEQSSQRKSYECSINTLKFVLHFCQQGNANSSFLEISFHTSHNSCCQEDRWQPVLVRLWRAVVPFSLLEGMQTVVCQRISKSYK